jgi:hypothetical protein
MNIYPLQHTILSALGDRWTKVAMVIARVASATGEDSNVVFGNHISHHISALVRDGRLEARGDVTNWRSSEVRRPGD